MKERDWDVNPEFFKVYLPDRSSKQLKIPPAFAKYFNGFYPQKSILTAPGKRTWSVAIRKVDDKLFLKNGWQGFVEDNRLEIGDFLVFSYMGSSNFNVTIFGSSGCKKSNQARDEKNAGNGENRNEYRINEQMIKLEQEDEARLDTQIMPDETGFCSLNDQIRTEHSKFVPRNQKKKSRKCKQLEPEKTSGSKIHVPIQDKVQEEAGKYAARYPHFTVKMKATYIKTGTLVRPRSPSSEWWWNPTHFLSRNAPLNFVQRYLRGVRQVVTLQVSSNSWPVKLTNYADRSARFSKGWLVFVRENNLQEGDVCVFELTRRHNPTFIVSITRCPN